MRSLALVCLALLSALAVPATAQAPQNDQRYNAPLISLPFEGASVTVPGTTVGATRGHNEFGVPCAPGGPASDNLETVWWEVSATTGRLTVDLAGTDVDAVVRIETFFGELVACAAGPNARIDGIPMGDQLNYYVRVSGVGAASGNVVLTTTRGPDAPAPNDDRASATPIAAQGIYVETTADATSEPGEPAASCASSDTGKSLWWSYTAPVDTLVTFDLAFPGYGTSPVLSVHDITGAERACALKRIEDVPVAAGETVLVRVSSGSSSTAGLATLAVWSGAAGRPPNDDRAQAGPIVLETQYSGTTAGATLEPAEAPPSCAPDAGRSVWWVYDAPRRAAVTARATRAGIVSVLDEAGTELACSADATLGPRLDGVVLPVGRFYVRFSDHASAAAEPGRNVRFTFDAEALLANDDRADAVEIAGPGIVLGTTNTATAEPDEPVLPQSCFQGEDYVADGNESAWWSYTAPTDGTLLIDLEGSEFDTIVSVHDEALAALACNNNDTVNGDPLDYTSLLANVPVEAGQRVLIRVSGSTSGSGYPSTGDVRLSLQLLPSAAVSTVATGTTAGAPWWRRPSIAGPVCRYSFNDPSFQAMPFTVPVEGYYSLTGRFEGHRGCVYAFRTPFDPAAWSCDAVVTSGCDSYSEPGVARSAPAVLVPGQDYVLVASGYENTDEGPYTIEALGPANVAFAQPTATERRAAGTTALSAPRPNPTTGAAALTLSLGAAEHVRVEVIDALGRRVALLRDGLLAAGDHTLALPATLPPGLYTVRASGETLQQTQRVTVVR